MKKLEKLLKDLQSKGFEQVTIIQVLQWIREIQREAQVNRIEKKSANQ